MQGESIFNSTFDVGSPLSTTRTVNLDEGMRLSLLKSQLDAIYGHITKAAFISTLFALALMAYLTPLFGATVAHWWFASKALVAAGRFGLAQAYRSEHLRSRPKLADTLAVASLVVDGAIWGFVGVWGANGQSEVVCLLVACLSSVAMLGTFGLQVRQRATTAYVVPMLAPMAFALALRGDALGLFGACGALLVLTQTLVTGHASEQRLKREFLAHSRVALALQERSNALNEASASKCELEAALEQLKRQSAVKSLFLGTMSHELRTPLHGILGMAELLEKGMTDPIGKHRLGLIRASGSHLLELIGALLDLSRIDSGRLELQDQPLDLAAELRALRDLYEVRCQGKTIGFEAVLDIPPSMWVRGDAARIRQVLHNLLGNAVKFTDQGLVRLQVRHHHGMVSFDVADTGPGISTRELPHIFEAFRQVDAAAARPSDGAGLGLAIARELAVAMGGDIVAHSVKGVGSRFTFTARLEALSSDLILAPIKAQAKTQIQAPVSSSFPPEFKVLVVEDNSVNVMIAQAHLDSLGIKSDVVGDGLQAVSAAFIEPRPDLILMDLRMPVKDGASASCEIRELERRAGLDPVTIIALTAMPTDEDRQKCKVAGMDGFLSKPFTRDELLSTIQAATNSASRHTMKDHPLYEFALSLGDMEPDLFGGVTMH
jgi:signal transduction histidine kinase/FixJ family two-component response regulator